MTLMRQQKNTGTNSVFCLCGETSLGRGIRSQRRTTVLTGLAGRGGARFWQVDTKRCRLSWLTNSALVCILAQVRREGGLVARFQPMSAAVQCTQEPK
jgi:hypothetical protein